MMILLAFAGAAGAICRFLAGSAITKYAKSYNIFGTTFINILGSFLLGICYGLSVKYPAYNDIYLIISVGFFGAFTTFSTFSYEAYSLYQTSKVKGIAFICLSIICACICAGLGVNLIV